MTYASLMQSIRHHLLSLSVCGCGCLAHFLSLLLVLFVGFPIPHFRCGTILRRLGSSSFILISRVRASRRRRYAATCSSSGSVGDGGSSTDQSWCRPAPGMMGQVSVAPLHRTITSSHRMPNVGWIRRSDARSGIPCSCNTCSARTRPCSSCVGVLHTYQRPSASTSRMLAASTSRMLAASKARLDPSAQRKRIHEAMVTPSVGIAFLQNSVLNFLAKSNALSQWNVVHVVTP